MTSIKDKEASYTVPFIMPCFYFTYMEQNPKIVIELYNHIKKEYDDFRKHKDSNISALKKVERELSTLIDNHSYFGFFIIFYFCLTKSNNICCDDSIKSFFEKDIEPIFNDINGFDLEDLKENIKFLLYKKINESSKKRQVIDINDNHNKIKEYYQKYLDYFRNIKLRSNHFIDSDTSNIKIKRIFFVSSSALYDNVNDSIIKNFGISNNDIINYKIYKNLSFCEDSNIKHSGCTCINDDCISMKRFFNEIIL